MEKEFTISIITGVFAIIAATTGIVGQFRIAKMVRDNERDRQNKEYEKEMSQYKEPLARAAADLQSRIYNIVKLGFFERYFVNGTDRERKYAVLNTVFLIAQFFAWTEAVRLEIQYLDLGDSESTRKLTHLQSDIYSMWQTDKIGLSLAIFAGEQRAIGEKMLKEGKIRLSCLGYGEFIDKDGFKGDGLFDMLHGSIETIAKDCHNSYERLIAIHCKLIDLIDFIDPNHLRFPSGSRSKLSGYDCKNY